MRQRLADEFEEAVEDGVPGAGIQVGGVAMPSSSVSSPRWTSSVSAPARTRCWTRAVSVAVDPAGSQASRQSRAGSESEPLGTGASSGSA